jgi:serine/threonine-protein kinase HipA
VSELLVIIQGDLVGRVRADKAGRLTLDYESDWRESLKGYSLSASLARAQATHLHKTVMSYLWNLLPENPQVLQRWAQQYHVSAANPFKLLMHVGADVPGAAQFLPPSWRMPAPWKKSTCSVCSRRWRTRFLM